jgi:hypothetical protein
MEDIKAKRDHALFTRGSFASLSHASDYRHAFHAAWQAYYRRAKLLRRSITANQAAIRAGHGLLLDLPGGMREARALLRHAAAQREQYISTYGSPMADD